MSKGLLDLIIDSICDANWMGRRGEKLTEKELKFAQLLGKKGKVLRNVYIPKDNNETSEIDLVFITQKGIFVFESKNYSGWIFGDEKSAYWTMMLPNKQKNSFYNPIKQNKTHIKWLGKYFENQGMEIPMFSIIVFSERCELKKINVTSSEIKVIKRDRTYATVRDIWNMSQDVLNKEQIEEIYVDLKQLTNVDAALKAAHIENIEKKYKRDNKTKETKIEKNITSEAEGSKDTIEISREDLNDVVENEATNEIAGDVNNTDLICPKCGATLVLRTARKGDNAGNQFYGCSAFPKCRFIKNI